MTHCSIKNAWTKRIQVNYVTNHYGVTFNSQVVYGYKLQKTLKSNQTETFCIY